jgi:hypothetical protein
MASRPHVVVRDPPRITAQPIAPEEKRQGTTDGEPRTAGGYAGATIVAGAPKR